MEDFTRIAVLPECIYLFNCNEELTSNTLDLLKKEEFTDTSLVNYKTVNVNLNKDLKYEKLYKWFDECILKVHNSYSFDCEKVSITQSWGCRYISGGHQHFHNHPNSLMSGVFFLTDSDTPTIFIKDTMWKDERCIRVSTRETDTKYRIYHVHPPKSGQLILFPSGMNHLVPKHEKIEDRYTISFNTFPSGKCGKEEDLMGVNIQIL